MGVQYADATPADQVPVRAGLERLLLRVDLLQLALGRQPVAELVGEEVALAATRALDEGVGVEQLQAAARGGQGLPAAHRSHRVLRGGKQGNVRTLKIL